MKSLSINSLVKAVLVSAIMFAVAPAKAGLLLEPYAGYHLGVLEASGPIAAKLDVSGLAIGGRVAFSIPLFFFGADYSMGKYSSKVASGAGLTGGNTDATQLFAVAGASLPLIRGWAGYGLMNEFKGADGSKLTGSAMKFGIGTTIFPFISVNAEYMTSTFDKIDGSALAGGLKLSETGFMLSASLPLDF